MQLLEKGAIDTPVFSLRVINGKERVLTVGGVETARRKKVRADKGRSELKEDLMRDDTPGTEQPLDEEKEVKEIKHQETRRNESVEK